MRIDSILGQGRPTVSFEFFPPKNEQGFAQLYQTIEELKPHAPSYVSVTYGAGGSTRRNTIELVGKIQNEIGIRAMAHLTCVGHTADEIGGILDELWNNGIRNVLALRGDPPAGQSSFVATPGGSASPATWSGTWGSATSFASASPDTRKGTRSASTARATWNT